MNDFRCSASSIRIHSKQNRTNLLVGLVVRRSQQLLFEVLWLWYCCSAFNYQSCSLSFEFDSRAPDTTVTVPQTETIDSASDNALRRRGSDIAPPRRYQPIRSSHAVPHVGTRARMMTRQDACIAPRSFHHFWQSPSRPLRNPNLRVWGH